MGKNNKNIEFGESFRMTVCKNFSKSRTSGFVRHLGDSRRVLMWAKTMKAYHSEGRSKRKLHHVQIDKD